MWFEVEAGCPKKVEFRSAVHFWPADEKNIALFLIEFEEQPAPDVLAEYKIAESVVGPYVYMNAPAQSGAFEQTILLPPAKIKRIGIRTWNHKEPILLEDLEVTAFGAEISSEYGVTRDVFLNDFTDFASHDRSPMLAVQQMVHGADCNAHCHAICQHWYETMDDVARRTSKENDVGRINCFFRLDDGSQVPVSVFNGTPAMLRIPESHVAYIEKIGDKARNMIRKAQRQGYSYRKVNPDEYLDDVLSIRTSDPERQGRPIPEYYKVRPTQIIEEPFRNGCKLHGEAFFGIFKDDKLVAYTTIFLYGELGQVNHILGHADHLQEGVMNLLVSEMVRDIIEHKPWVRAVNYLYPHMSNMNTGLGLFKRSIGFAAERVVVARTQRELGSYFSNPNDDLELGPADAPSEKKLVRATTSKAVKVASTKDLISLPLAKNKAQALELLLDQLNKKIPDIQQLKYRSEIELKGSDFAVQGVHVVVLDGIPFADFQQFLSTGLKGLRKIFPKESFLVFNFKRVICQDYAEGIGGFSRLIQWFSMRKTSRITEELTTYFLKRFKSINLSIDDIRGGFKGSDYVVAGLVDYENKKQHDAFDSWLIVRKIR